MTVYTAIIYRSENVKETDDGWRDYDGTVEARQEIFWEEDLSVFRSSVLELLAEFVDEHMEEKAYLPEVTVLIDGVPVSYPGRRAHTFIDLQDMFNTWLTDEVIFREAALQQQKEEARQERERKESEEVRTHELQQLQKLAKQYDFELVNTKRGVV